MKKSYTFGKNYDLTKDFIYVYSPAARSHTAFDLEENCIVNRKNTSLDGQEYPYDYVSIVTKEKVCGVRAATVCDFEDFGAPLIVFSNDLKDVNGEKYYGEHFEVVAYEDGINIWYIVPGEEAGTVKPKLIAEAHFPVAAGKPVKLTVTVQGKTLKAEMLGQELSVCHDRLPETFHIGITACENVNRFYSFEIEEA